MSEPNWVDLREVTQEAKALYDNDQLTREKFEVLRQRAINATGDFGDGLEPFDQLDELLKIQEEAKAS